MNETELTNTVVVLKKCTNHIRGCRVVLDEDYSKKKCQDCLRKERESDKRRRDEAKAKQQVPLEDEINRVCTTCCQEYTIDHFQGQRANTTTKTCKTCRENNKKQDSKRDREHRNELARECSKKPEQIARKKEWVENNYDKVAETWQRHRQKQIVEDAEQYLRKNADQAKKWREANPEKCAENAEMIKNSIHHQFTTTASNKMSKPELEQYHLDRKNQRIVHLQDRYTNENIQQNAQTIANKRTYIQAQTKPVE